MNFTAIDGKDIKDLDYKEMREFFVDHVFFKFMDHGREGIKLGLIDAIHNFEQWLVKTNVRYQKTKPTISRDAHDIILREASRTAIDGFIREGSKGIAYAITVVQQMVAEELINPGTYTK